MYHKSVNKRIIPNNESSANSHNLDGPSIDVKRCI